MLVPFLSASEIYTRLAEVEACGVLSKPSLDRSKRLELVSALNACLFDHPIFFEARETRTIQDEFHFWQDPRWEQPQDLVRRYEIEQRVTIADRKLLDDSLVHIWIPVPCAIEGVQEVRLLEAEPARLADFYLPIAGQIYGVPILIERGKPAPSMYLRFQVEQKKVADRYVLADHDMHWHFDMTDERELKTAAAWEKTLGIDQATATTTENLVDLLVDRIENEFRFALSARTVTPISSLVNAGAGDVQMCTQLLAAALSNFGLSTRIRSGQRLMLNCGRSTLYYPGSAGYENVFLEWRDPYRDESGFVDLSYLERWCYVATKANTTNDHIRNQLREVGTCGRAWLRRNPYPIDFIFAGYVPRSRMHSFSTDETCTVYAPVDVELEALRVQL